MRREPIMGHDATRRRLLTTGSALLAAAQLPAMAASPLPEHGVRLQPLPTRIFKTRDPGNERTESWILWLLVEASTQRPLTVQSANIQLLCEEQVVRATRYGEAGVRALTIAPPFTPKLPDGRASPTPIYWPQAVRIRCSEAAAAKVDAMRVVLALDASGARIVVDRVLPVESYEQKTRLIYPFKDEGVITNAGAANGGHRNRSGQFALDGVGLDPRYGVYIRGTGTKSDDYAGWGRELLAPAAGVVVRARRDRPDQPDPEKSDPAFYAPEYPNGGDPGNHLVIDHGN